MNYYSHIVFALKHSRYEIEKINRKKPIGFIGRTYPYIKGAEEEVIIEELCKAAVAVRLSIVSLNFCGDHVHAIIKSESYDQSIKIGHWKGKTAYAYNRRVNSSVNSQMAKNSERTKRSLWAKGYYQKYLDSEEKFAAAKSYVLDNRIKHGLPPLTTNSLEHIKNLISHIDL